MLLIRSNDNRDPLGRKKDVSNETSTSESYNAIDWTEGEGWRTEDSKRNLTRMPMVGDQGVGQTTKFARMKINF